MRFEFATAARIVFGEGTLREVPAAAADLVVQGAKASSMKGNPIGLTGEELREIIARAI